jgi:hypothetical protein
MYVGHPHRSERRSPRSPCIATQGTVRSSSEAQSGGPTRVRGCGRLARRPCSNALAAGRRARGRRRRLLPRRERGRARMTPMLRMTRMWDHAPALLVRSRWLQERTDGATAMRSCSTLSRADDCTKNGCCARSPRRPIWFWCSPFCSGSRSRAGGISTAKPLVFSRLTRAAKVRARSRATARREC